MGALLGFTEQALRLIEQTGILEGNAHRADQGLQQAHIILVIGVRPITLDAHNASCLLADQDGHSQKCLVEILFVVWRRDADRPQPLLFLSGAGEHRLSGADHGRIESLPERQRLDMRVPSLFDIIDGGYMIISRLIHGDVSGIGAEDLPDFISHEGIDRLHIQLGCQPLLDAVDNAKLGGALLGLFEQTLCFVEETGILEGDAHRVGKGVQEM